MGGALNSRESMRNPQNSMASRKFRLERLCQPKVIHSSVKRFDRDVRVLYPAVNNLILALSRQNVAES